MVGMEQGVPGVCKTSASGQRQVRFLNQPPEYAALADVVIAAV